MANRKRSARERSQGREWIKFLKFGAIPVIVILLIIVIMIADRQGETEGSHFPATESVETKDTEDTAEAGAVTDTDEKGEGSPNGTYGEQEIGSTGASGDSPGSGNAGDMANDDQASADPIPAADPFSQPLQQDALLELTGLVRLYCEAKTDCDADLLAQVFGIGDWTEERKEEERAKMELVKASVKSYENISCYSVQGPETDSYVIFPYYELRYRETETLVPAISWAYVKKDENGQYYMVSETDESVNAYIRQVGEKPEVKAVMAQVQARQQEAIDSDEILQKIYGGNGGSEVVINGQ